MRAAGHAADVATRGEDAVWMAGSTAYSAIVLDVMLPGQDGFETCRRLRADGVRTPVLMLTARDAVSDRVKGLDRGADDYLVKPFALTELLARLRALIRRTTGQADTLIALGDVVLDTTARTVTRAGQLVHLTAREYALIEFLALRRGTLVTRTTLYEHLFDENDESFSNLMDVHV